MEYTVKPIKGYTDKSGELVFMLEHVRVQTMQDIEFLQQQQIDKTEFGNGNSIGALLLHIAAIEKVHQLIAFEDRDFTEAEFAEWGSALVLGDKARMEITGEPLDYYIKSWRL